jgi:ABC-type transport system substrate-binding protein
VFSSPTRTARGVLRRDPLPHGHLCHRQPRADPRRRDRLRPSGLPESSYPQLAAEFPDQFFVNPRLGFRFLALNTRRPLFSDVRIRKAVNYAIDRPALAEANGPFASTPTDNYLPPAMPGFGDAHIYPLDGPD